MDTLKDDVVRRRCAEDTLAGKPIGRNRWRFQCVAAALLLIASVAALFECHQCFQPFFATVPKCRPLDLQNRTTLQAADLACHASGKEKDRQ